MSFLDGGKRGNAGNNGEGNNGPEHRRHGKEEQRDPLPFLRSVTSTLLLLSSHFEGR